MIKKKKIIIVSPSLDPSKNVSGISSVAQFIIQNNSVHEYIHFCVGREDAAGKGLRRITSNLSKLWRWVRLLRRFPNALVHYNFPLEKPSVLRDPLFMYAAKWMGHDMVVHIHGGVFLSLQPIPFPFKQILANVFSWKNSFVALSDNEKDLLREKFKVTHAYSLPNCVDLSDAKNFKREIKKDSSPLVLGFLGRIAETKGMDYLLQACVELKKNQVPFILKLAGPEEEKDRYLPKFSEALGGQFEYVGLVFGQLKCNFLRSLDVLVMPTFFEGLPMSLLECMGYGIVPVITPVGSIPRVVRDGENGIFVILKNSQTIYSSIKFLQENREKLSLMGEKARNTVFEQFSPEKYIQDLNLIYDL